MQEGQKFHFLLAYLYNSYGIALLAVKMYPSNTKYTGFV